MSIDHKANDRLNEAVRRKEEAAQEVEERKAALKQELQGYADAHLEDFEKSQKEMLEESMLVAREAAANEKERLQQIFDHNAKRWVDELFVSVVEDQPLILSTGQVR